MGNTKKQRKRLPPEELYRHPDDYYEGETLYQYTHSKSLMRIQEKITKRAVEIVQAESPALILDVGMGCGFSSSYLYLNDFNVVGIDLIHGMLAAYDICELNPINATMNEIPLRNGQFDYIFSISAFQWIVNKLGPKKRKKVLKRVAIRFNQLLKLNGKAIIQFYPLTEEILSEIGSIFVEFGKFDGNFVIDNPEGGPKRKTFLYLQKEAELE